MDLTLTDQIQRAILHSLDRHRAALDAAVGLTALQLDVKLDPKTNAPAKVILRSECALAMSLCVADRFTFLDP